MTVERPPGLPASWNLGGDAHEIPLPDDVPGRLVLTSKHAVGPDPDAALARHDADTIVCLTERHELDDRYPGYVDWLDARRGTSAVWFPIPDLHAPDATAARPFFDELVRRLGEGETLIVHCAAGIGRAGTTAVALLLLLGERLPDALAHVAAHRPLAGPEVGAQRELVERLAAQLGRS